MTTPSQAIIKDQDHTEDSAKDPGEFPFDLDTPEGEQQWQQWLQNQAQSRLEIVREQLKKHGLVNEHGWTLPNDLPDDMKSDSETSTATG